jgi:hypothetical protein
MSSKYQEETFCKFDNWMIKETSKGEISFSMRMDWISRRQRSPSRGFFAKWSTWAESRLRMVRAGWRLPRLSLKYCSRNLAAWSLTHTFKSTVVSKEEKLFVAMNNQPWPSPWSAGEWE